MGSLSGTRLPEISLPIASTHQQMPFFGSHCIFSNSPVTLLQRGTNWSGPSNPRARERFKAASVKCSHPVSLVVIHREPHLVMQQRSPGSFRQSESFLHCVAFEGHGMARRGHRSIVFGTTSVKHQSYDLRLYISDRGNGNGPNTHSEIVLHLYVQENNIYIYIYIYIYFMRFILFSAANFSELAGGRIDNSVHVSFHCGDYRDSLICRISSLYIMNSVCLRNLSVRFYERRFKSDPATAVS